MVEKVNYDFESRSGAFPLALDSQGSTIVEYAIVLPLFMLLLLGIIELSVVYYSASVLEGSLVTAAREGKTGYPDLQNDAMRLNYVNGILNSGVKGLIDPANLTIVEKSYQTFSDVGQPEPCITKLCGGGVAGVDYVDVNGNGRWDPDQGKTGLGDAGDVVLYTASYSMPVPYLSSFFPANSYTLTASAMVKNEPFAPIAPPNPPPPPVNPVNPVNPGPPPPLNPIAPPPPCLDPNPRNCAQ